MAYRTTLESGDIEFIEYNPRRSVCDCGETIYEAKNKDVVSEETAFGTLREHNC